MSFALRLLRNSVSCCLNCGSFAVRDAGLCGECLIRANDLQSSNLFVVPPFRCRALYEWYSGESDLLSRLILSLKGGGRRSSWSYFAKKFSKERVRELRGKRVIVVPAPPRIEGRKDHGFLWAESLALCLGAELYPCLKRASKTHQRALDRGDRALVEMTFCENSTRTAPLCPENLWIFADDVLTTGSTARAAHRALGRPPHFEAWVLARRSLSCGASRDLL